MDATMEAIRGGDLYALLSVCTDDDLDPLVKIIAGRFSNFLDIDEDYKKHQPRHSRYHKLIGDEIRRYGGNSFRNLFRGGGPPYDEIVIDVCKKLGVPCELGQTAKNEDNLLTLHLERQWKALSKEEQDAIIEKARAEAVGHISTKATLVKGGLSFFLARTLLGPAGWGLLAINVADPAFKITVPCVLHIAYLRRTVLDRAAVGASSDAPSIRPAPRTPNTASNLPVSVSRSESLLIGASPDRPVLSLTRVSDAPSQGWYPVEDSDHGIGRLSPLLQAVPALAAARDMATTNYMEVVITNGGQLVKAKGPEGGFRAIVRGPDGKITENARLFEPSQLENIVNVGALLQVTSVVLAQKHLADISAKLSDIKAGIDRIQNFQQNQRRSVLTGATRYFAQVAPSVLAGELSEGVRHRIEQHEADLLQVQEHLMGDIRSEGHAILNVKDSDMFGSKGMQGAIQAHQTLLGDLYRQLLLCIRARACGWQLLVVFPGEERLKENRKLSIQESLDLLVESGDLLKQTDTFTRRKIKELSSLWNSATTLNERKLALLEWNDAIVVEVASCKDQIARDIRAAEAVVRDARNPVTAILRLDGERITAACTI